MLLILHLLVAAHYVYTTDLNIQCKNYFGFLTVYVKNMHSCVKFWI